MKLAEKLLSLHEAGKNNINKEILNQAKQESRGFPDFIGMSVKKGKMLFVHSYPNLDAAKNGMNVIGRINSLTKDGDVIVANAKDVKVKEGEYVFIGAVGEEGKFASGYIESIKDGFIYISGMGSDEQ